MKYDTKHTLNLRSFHARMLSGLSNFQTFLTFQDFFPLSIINIPMVKKTTKTIHDHQEFKQTTDIKNNPELY